MPPPANLRLRCDAHLFGSKARALLQPGGRTHTAMRMRWSTAAHVASRAGSLLSRTPLPAPASRAAHPAKCAGLCGAHTHSGLPRARGGGTRRLRRAATARVRHALFRLATPPTPCPHTHGPRSCTWPTLRRTPTLPSGMHAVRTRVPSARLVACACSALRLAAASAPDQRPATAKPHRPLHGTRTALRPAARCPRRGSTSQKETYSPVPVGVPLCPLARPFCRTALGSRGVPAASCAMHCTPLVQDPPGTRTAPAPPRPTRAERTRCSHEGIDTQPAHGQVSVAQ